VSKLTTLASGLASSIFTQHLNILTEDYVNVPFMYFDCRAGQYDSWEEAQSILLWRGYDCSLNGITDAIHQIPYCPKEVNKSNTTTKLLWLQSHNLLPIPSHQAYGSYYVKVKRIHTGYNPMLEKNIVSLRPIIEQIQSPIIELFRSDRLLLTDDTL
jgi:tRNA(His) 5'-end guanylyltransferase